MGGEGEIILLFLSTNWTSVTRRQESLLDVKPYLYLVSWSARLFGAANLCLVSGSARLIGAAVLLPLFR